jgi:hypothetical protein
MIESFYVVTRTSVYHVYVENGKPVAEKIAIYGTSAVPVGTKMQQGEVVGITPSGLLACNRTTLGFLPIDNTTPIVALFLEKETALACSKSENLENIDSRWKDEMSKTIRAIGAHHPLFVFGKLTTFNLPPTTSEIN